MQVDVGVSAGYSLYRARTPRTVYPREDPLRDAVNGWIGGLFSRENVDRTIRQLIDSQPRRNVADRSRRRSACRPRKASCARSRDRTHRRALPAVGEAVAFLLRPRSDGQGIPSLSRPFAIAGRRVRRGTPRRSAAPPPPVRSNPPAAGALCSSGRPAGRGEEAPVFAVLASFGPSFLLGHTRTSRTFPHRGGNLHGSSDRSRRHAARRAPPPRDTPAPRLIDHCGRPTLSTACPRSASTRCRGINRGTTRMRASARQRERGVTTRARHGSGNGGGPRE